MPFIDGGEGTVLQHLKLGLEFTKNHLGEHGVPLFLGSDWNDSLSKISWEKHKAESAFVFFQAAHAAYELIHLFEHLKDAENTQWAKQYYEWCRSVEPVLWDGKWYLRGFTDYGEKYGTDDDEYNKIFLNPQSWAVLSRLPSADKGNSCFENVKKYLFCDLGVVSHAPASSGIDFQKKYFFGMKTGIRENADFSSTRARGPLSRRRFSEEMRMRTPSITESFPRFATTGRMYAKLSRISIRPPWSVPPMSATAQGNAHGSAGPPPGCFLPPLSTS